MSKEKLKFKVISRLLNGEASKAIAESEGVPYPTVLRWNRELAKAQDEDSLAELVNVDQAILDTVLDEIKSNTPVGLQDAAETATVEVRRAKSAAETLQEDMQRTAIQINDKIKRSVIICDGPGELSILTDSLCTLYNAFFNKNSTQVNVQNNYDASNRAYSSFLSDNPDA